MTDREILESLKPYTCKPEVIDEAVKSLGAMRNIADIIDGKHPLIAYIQEDVMRYKMIEEIVRESTTPTKPYLMIPFPDGATNGDMIKELFPNAEIRFMVNLSDMHSVHVKFGDNTYLFYDDHVFSREWWDAPYKR